MALASALSGCALNLVGETEVASAWERHRSSGEVQAAGYARIPARFPAETLEAIPATRPALDTPTSLRDYILSALRDNPEILQAEAAARARAARIAQMTALPDPMLDTKTFTTPFMTSGGDSYFILGVRQTLPVPEKLDRPGRIALEETRMAIAEWDQVRLRVIADVKRAYFQTYVLRQTVRITQENQNLLRGLIDVARGQVSAGRRQQEDVLRAQVELSTLEAQLIELRQRLVVAEAMLNTLLSRAPTAPIAITEELAPREIDASLETLFARAAEVNPELKRYTHQIERDRQAVALSRLAYWPDLTVGFEWMQMQPRPAFQPPRDPNTGRRPEVDRLSEEGGDNWAIMLSINVPLWIDKIEAGIRDARHQLSASLQGYAAARNLVHFRIQDALTQVQAQRELADLFATTIIPQARQAYEVSLAGYTTGTSDFLYVIDNWQKWLNFTVQYHRAAGELERAVADLEQAVGQSLAECEQ